MASELLESGLVSSRIVLSLKPNDTWDGLSLRSMPIC